MILQLGILWADYANKKKQATTPNVCFPGKRQSESHWNKAEGARRQAGLSQKSWEMVSLGDIKSRQVPEDKQEQPDD